MVLNPLKPEGDRPAKIGETAVGVANVSGDDVFLADDLVDETLDGRAGVAAWCRRHECDPWLDSDGSVSDDLGVTGLIS